MESISIAALQTQADTIDDMLKTVSEKLFGLSTVVSGKSMRVSLRLIEQSVDYEVAPGKRTQNEDSPAPPMGEPATEVVVQQTGTDPQKEDEEEKKKGKENKAS